MPLLDYTKLVGHKQHRLAHMCLTFIGSAYVWQDGEDGVPTVTIKLRRCVFKSSFLANTTGLPVFSVYIYKC